MNNISPYLLYVNSYLHFSRDIIREIDDKKYEIKMYLLDKRFILTNNVDYIEANIPYCKVKDYDKYYYAVYSSCFLNKSSLFYKLIEKSILYNIDDFIKLL